MILVVNSLGEHQDPRFYSYAIDETEILQSETLNKSGLSPQYQPSTWYEFF